MAQSNSAFFDEAANAIRGCIALVMGKRDSSSYFDFSQRGLVGSLIAVLAAMILAGFGPLLLGAPMPSGAATQSIVINAVLFVAQAFTAYLALRQMGRQDGFIPYLVASNWVTLLSAILLLVATIFGPLGIIVLLGTAVIAILTFVNIGRFIVTLAPLQIGLLFLSQAVGVFLALGLVTLILPAPPMP
ncbi:hypothetical protein [Devosia sp. Leaf64]|uniref:hypothetical protein n=1 Tax=Devosia sp. Leaf64 TaxID=1736229 RepID=UPI000712AF4C|nr:hypothetical protein [Devosia sp. Leaf64]KQN76921.1 hypothetical protein ASE94_18530 [Devosia sp. Leaf64]